MQGYKINLALISHIFKLWIINLLKRLKGCIIIFCIEKLHELISICGRLEHSHPITRIILDSKNPRYTCTSRNSMKSTLKEIDSNLSIVFKHLRKNQQGTKIQNIKKELQLAERAYEVIAEVTWFANWISKGIPIDIEPIGKGNEGPDAKLTVRGTNVFCEITAMNIPNRAAVKYSIENKILDEISDIDPKYIIHITTGKDLLEKDVPEIVHHIKNEIAKNYGKRNFNSVYNEQISLAFADSPLTYVEIHRIPSEEELKENLIFDPTKDRVYKKMEEKLHCQLSKAGEGPKVLVLDYGRIVDSQNSHPMFFENQFKTILGPLELQGNMVIEFSLNDLSDLSGIIAVYHTNDKLNYPLCLINKIAKYTINKSEIRTIGDIN